MCGGREACDKDGECVEGERHVMRMGSVLRERGM